MLAAWQGLGYYRRARNLKEAARQIMRLHGGRVPADREVLETLPGIGPYCAGAISSIAFGKREPIVDGNVARVLMRIHGRNVDATSGAGKRWLWTRAREYVNAARDPACANEGLMELGAVVCTPRTPQCGGCPLRGTCVARSCGSQGQIPRPKRRGRKRILHSQVIIARIRGRFALERRAATGLWAGLMFAPTIESDRALGRAAVAKRLRVTAGALTKATAFKFETTHRSIHFQLWILEEEGARRLKELQRDSWSWHSRRGVEELSITSAMRRIFNHAFAVPSLREKSKRVL